VAGGEVGSMNWRFRVSARGVEGSDVAGGDARYFEVILVLRFALNPHIV